MSLRIVGAGLPRTGTMSLKSALERLLGRPCYHMDELLRHPEHAPTWREAVDGRTPDWGTFLDGYSAVVDDPASRFWRELTTSFPEALVLLSQRDSAETWHRSMDETILRLARQLNSARADDTGYLLETPWWWPEEADTEQLRALEEMFAGMPGATFSAPDDREALIEEYDQRLAEVRASIPAERLIEWQPGDGWQPLCDALGLRVPDEPFPHTNSTPDFSARVERASQ